MNPPGLFVTGSDTEVGKTYVTAMIARWLHEQGVRVGVYKPAASGCPTVDGELLAEDALALWSAAGKPGELSAVCPQKFAAPLAPHRAAEAEGKQIDVDLLRSGLDYWKSRSEFLLVEGAGGLMSPISQDDYVADLASEFGYPLLVVVPNTLGVINQTLQTLITAATFREGLPTAGVILNDSAGQADPSTDTNPAELAARCGPPLLAHVPHGALSFEPAVDWRGVAGSV